MTTINLNLTDKFNQAFQGWTIDIIGVTSELRGNPIEGGLTFMLSKGELKRKVILGYTELGAWVEDIEEVISQEFLDISRRIIEEQSDTLEALAKGPKCDDKSCKDCYGRDDA